jgi:uncharacterized protein
VPFIVLSCAIQLGACTSARVNEAQANRYFKQERYEEAAEKLVEGLKKQGDNSLDELLYLMDIGLSYHLAGKYKESNQYFTRADKIAAIKDYKNLAEESAGLVTSDMIIPYKGEDFEKVMINTYMALNYTLMGDYENALVEAKLVNRKLLLMVTEGKKKYKQNTFARYLSGILYEALGEIDEAYIDYKETYELDDEIPGLGADLWLGAHRMKWVEDEREWRKEYELKPEDEKKALSRIGKLGAESAGELIVVFQNGIGPQKHPHPNFHSVPKFYPRFNPTSEAQIEVDGKVVGKTYVLHDIESTAIKDLDEKYAGIIAKKVGGIIVKEGIGYGVEKATDSPLLGFITKVALHAADQADVRSWNLLPKDLQMARIVLKPGEYVVNVRPDGEGRPLQKTITIEAGKKSWINYRCMP